MSFLVHRIYLFEQYDFDGRKHAGGDTYARLAEQARALLPRSGEQRRADPASPAWEEGLEQA